MHYVIVGCGRVGKSLTSHLLDLGHSVALIDKDPERFREVERHENLTTLVGIGFDRTILESAHISDAHAVAAVTSGDNSNIVVARITKEIFHVPHVIARIYDPNRASLYHRLGISTVASVTWTTDQFIKRLTPESDSIDWVDTTGNVVIVERLLPSFWAGKSLDSLFIKGKFTLIASSHLGTTSVASPNTKAHENDRVFVACNKEYVDELNSLLDKGADE